MQAFKKLDIWKRSHLIVLEIYDMTKDFPESEERNIISQMRRASTSIPSNIAEGASSLFDRNFLSHLSIAYASGKELESFLLMSRDLGYVRKQRFERAYKELDRLNSMIFNLIKKMDLRIHAKKSILSDAGSVIERSKGYISSINSR